jgi:hypothetical protein
MKDERNKEGVSGRWKLKMRETKRGWATAENWRWEKQREGEQRLQIEDERNKERVSGDWVIVSHNLAPHIYSVILGLWQVGFGPQIYKAN